MRAIESKIKELYQNTKHLLRKSTASDALDYSLTDTEYQLLQKRMRGGDELVRERFLGYLPILQGRRCVLDVGCGDGLFLELLAENCIQGMGVDLNAEQVEICRKRGVSAEVADAFEFLRRDEVRKFDAICAFHVIEHLTFPELRAFLFLSFHALQEGGRLILEYPNIQNIFTLTRYYYSDPTHQEPRSPELVRLVVEQVGFKDVEINYIHDGAPHEHFKKDFSSVDSDSLSVNFEKLDNYFFFNADAQILATKVT